MIVAQENDDTVDLMMTVMTGYTLQAGRDALAWLKTLQTKRDKNQLNNIIIVT